MCIPRVYQQHETMQELWALLASASTTESGVPQAILDEKAEELRKRKEAQDQLNVGISAWNSCAS